MSLKPIPQKLYKYRTFDINSLKLLVDGQTYYADPRNFNDPLDCNPEIEVDVDRSSLEKLFLKLQSESQTDAWKAGTRQAGLSGINSECRKSIIQQMRDFANDRLEEIKCYSNQPDREYKADLTYNIEKLLKSNMGTNGVFSLSEIWNCRLMWSHYADEHRGICIEYDTTLKEHPHLSAVDYQRPGIIKMSDVVAWKLDHSVEAEKRVHLAYFFTKASPWQYEREWRDIRPCTGAFDEGFQVTSVYFGYACDDSIQKTIFKLFQQPSKLRPKLYIVKRNGYELIPHDYSDPQFAYDGVRVLDSI